VFSPLADESIRERSRVSFTEDLAQRDVAAGKVSYDARSANLMSNVHLSDCVGSADNLTVPNRFSCGRRKVCLSHVYLISNSFFVGHACFCLLESLRMHGIGESAGKLSRLDWTACLNRFL
jgi:hypothetical protein